MKYCFFCIHTLFVMCYFVNDFTANLRTIQLPFLMQHSACYWFGLENMAILNFFKSKFNHISKLVQ